MTPSPPGDDRSEIETLCTAAAGVTGKLGHRIGAWEHQDEGAAVARRATCSRCSATVYVRIEGGLSGMAGEACTRQCPEH